MVLYIKSMFSKKSLKLQGKSFFWGKTTQIAYFDVFCKIPAAKPLLHSVAFSLFPLDCYN